LFLTLFFAVLREPNLEFAPHGRTDGVWNLQGKKFSVASSLPSFEAVDLTNALEGGTGEPVVLGVQEMFINPQDYDFDDLEKHIALVEDDTRCLTDKEKDPHTLEKAEQWIKCRGYMLAIILIVIWTILSYPAFHHQYVLNGERSC
jgi:hypothetical protein